MHIDRVTKPVGNGTCGEVVTPRCVSRLSVGRLRNTNRLIRVYGLKCRLHRHDLMGGMWTQADDSFASICEELSYRYADSFGIAWSASLAREVCIDLRNARIKIATGNLTNVFESDK